MVYHDRNLASKLSAEPGPERSVVDALDGLQDALVERLSTERHRLSVLRWHDPARAHCVRRIEHLERQLAALAPLQAEAAGQLTLPWGSR